LGVNSNPLCAPLQKGWFPDNPQEHQAYFLSFIASIAIGALLNILGNFILIWTFFIHTIYNNFKRRRYAYGLVCIDKNVNKLRKLKRIQNLKGVFA